MASKVARNKLIRHGRERVQAASKTWHPRERSVVVVAVGFRCRIRSRERPTIQNAPTHQRKERRIQTRCPLSVAVLPFQKSSPPSPGSRQDTAKTRPSHTNSSKKLDPLRHRRFVLPSFPFFRACRSLRYPLRTLLTANSSQDPPC